MPKIIEKLLNSAGIEINGDRPWDIQVKNEKLFSRLLSGGSLAVGESYMDGWWECDSIDQLITKAYRAELDKKLRSSKELAWKYVKEQLFNLQNISKAKIVGKKHYDVGNDLYKLMLDKRMNYSCGYWKDAKDLDDAQEAKLDLICKKLNLKSNQTLLDIGCGWGSMVKFACENYGVKAVGITISKEQAKLAKEMCHGLDIEIRLQDYRELDEQFDKIVSIGMFEHVGCKNYQQFFAIVNRNLKNDGLFLLQTIALSKTAKTIDPWIEKYIFPNGMLPSAKQITASYEKLFRLEDWHSFGTDYDKTLMAWYQNFINNWGKIKDKYDERFKRMWTYYLLSCAGSFRSGVNQLWQIVFSKISSQPGYESVR